MAVRKLGPIARALNAWVARTNMKVAVGVAAEPESGFDGVHSSCGGRRRGRSTRSPLVNLALRARSTVGYQGLRNQLFLRAHRRETALQEFEPLCLRIPPLLA